jgi:hypothetical protein
LHACCASVTVEESCGAHLSIRPSGDSILPTQFLEGCQADPELLCHLLLGHDKVLAERLQRINLGRCWPGDDASALLPGWPHSCSVSLSSHLAWNLEPGTWIFKMGFRLQHGARLGPALGCRPNGKETTNDSKTLVRPCCAHRRQRSARNSGERKPGPPMLVCATMPFPPCWGRVRINNGTHQVAQALEIAPSPWLSVEGTVPPLRQEKATRSAFAFPTRSK